MGLLLRYQSILERTLIPPFHHTPVMKRTAILIPFLCLTLQSCGPNKAELRAELQSIDHELVILRNAAYRYQSQMDQAEFATLIGSFATGYGATSGDGELVGDGVGTVVEASGNYDVASYSLDQIKQRQAQLLTRRNQIVAKLN